MADIQFPLNETQIALLKLSECLYLSPIECPLVKAKPAIWCVLIIRDQ